MAATGEGSSQPQIPDYKSYTTIAEFGYEFNSNGQLRDSESGEAFQFEVHGKGKTRANQGRYEALGEVITLEVFRLLEKEGLRRLPCPFDADSDEPQSFIFASEGAEKADSLLILIHGTGVVRAGQWARRLIINKDLDWGTQIPYIRHGLDRGWGVLVLNTNYNRDPIRGGEYIRGSETSDKHGIYVWKHWVRQAKAKKIVIVAHSAGGYVTGSIAKTFNEDFTARVKAVAFTDSFCQPHAHISKVGRNWVTSQLPLNEEIRRGSLSHLREFSAGTSVHEESSHAAIKPVWTFFDDAMAEEAEQSVEKESEKEKEMEMEKEKEKEKETEVTPLKDATEIPEDPVEKEKVEALEENTKKKEEEKDKEEDAMVEEGANVQKPVEVVQPTMEEEDLVTKKRRQSRKRKESGEGMESETSEPEIGQTRRRSKRRREAADLWERPVVAILVLILCLLAGYLLLQGPLV